MRYHGGKSRIAREIATKIRQMFPTSREIWDCFCGGGAMSEALMREGFHVHASDSHEDLILMWQAAQRGDDVFGSVSESEYAALRGGPPSARRGFAGYALSFGGSWFGGFARDSTGKRDFAAEAKRNNDKILAAGAADFALADYTCIPADILAYCDPEYKGTKAYKDRQTFDHNAFWTWVLARRGPTFVSELTGPEGLPIVWRKDLVSSNSRNSPTTKATASRAPREEHLYFKAATT